MAQDRKYKTKGSNYKPGQSLKERIRKTRENSITYGLGEKIASKLTGQDPATGEIPSQKKKELPGVIKGPLGPIKTGKVIPGKKKIY